MKDAWVLYLAVHNVNKDGMKKATQGFAKCNPFTYLHHSWREGRMAKLEENGYVYLQSALDHSLKKI